MPGTNAPEPTRRSSRLSQPPAGAGATPRETRDVRKSGRKTRTPIPPDQISAASGSSSKSQPKRVRTRARSPEREVEKRTLKRKRGDDEDDAGALKARIQALESQKAELAAYCSKLQKEVDTISSKQAALDEREKDMLNWEQIRSMSVEERAKQLLKKIENTFTCPLCVDVMACPYTLTVNSQCGHTFCASCIVKYKHIELNSAAKTLHFDCPVCRKGIVWGTSRPTPCFLAPNRLTRDAILEQLNELADILGELPTPKSPSRDAKGKKRSHRHESMTNVEETVLDWRIGGSLRIDWERRDREGTTKILAGLRVAAKP